MMWKNGKWVKAALSGGIALALLPLAGCGGPTYGTGKSSGKQLAEDFSNITSWRSLSSNKNVDYRPRPELVRPSSADLSAPLPPPQEAVAHQDNPNWPESPEQRRARLRAEATANQNNPNYVSPIVQDDAPKNQVYYPSGIDRARERQDNMPNARITKQQTERFRELRDGQAASAKTRKYLSDPPLDYLKPAPNAPVGDLGEAEENKERKNKGGRSSLFGKKGVAPIPQKTLRQQGS